MHWMSTLAFGAVLHSANSQNDKHDVIGTVVSVLDAIPFNNYGKDQLRRTIILEDVVQYFNAKPSVSPAMYSTKLYLNDDIEEIAAFRQSQAAGRWMSNGDRFKMDFILIRMVLLGDLQDLLCWTGKSSRFSYGSNIPFNLEDSPQTVDGTTEGNETNTNGEGCSKETENDGGDSGSGKRTIIDLDDYYEKPAVAKRNKVIQVKLEPKD
ncbi:hypothetical protein Tco_0144722 [Tanacetum coccineum]